MARLFTISNSNKIEKKDDEEMLSDIEIDLDPDNPKEETELRASKRSDRNNSNMTTESFNSNSTAMQETRKQQQKPNSADKKLLSTWLSLQSLPSQELVSELKEIHEYLSPIDQDHVDRTRLINLAEQLASPSLIKHKDKAVRVLVACSIANILRLFAPDAPYSMEQFEMIFMLFIHQLKGLSEADGIYYNYHYFLLESLSTVKTIVLIFDLPQADLLQREIIQLALDMMHPSLPKNVRLYLLELVQTLLDECDQIPVDLVVDLLIPHLSISALSASTNELSKIFVEDLLRQSAEKLQGPLAVHFSDQLAKLARADEPESILIRIGREAHDFAVTIACISATASLSIISLLEEELKVEAQEIRLQSIQALARIFTHHQQNYQIIARSPAIQGAWTNWLGRKNDKSPRCRSAWIRGAMSILGIAIKVPNHSVCDQLFPLIIERLQDPDEKVRLITVQSLSAEILPVSKGIPSSSGLVVAIADRCLDRKEEVQQASLALASDWLFSILSGSSNTDLAPLIQRLLQLPFSESRVHSIAFMGFLEKDIFVRMAREFPQFNQRAEKMVTLFTAAFDNEHAHSAYRALLRQKCQFLKAWTALLKLARLPDNALTDIHRAKVVQLCQFLAERISGVSELEANRALLSVMTLKDAQSDSFLLQMLIDLAEDRTDGNALNLMTRIEAHVKASTFLSISLKRVINAAIPFGSLISLNTSLIGQLALIPSAAPILQDILTDFPQLFANRTSELISNVISSNGSTPSLVSLSQYLSSSSDGVLKAIKACEHSILSDLDVILFKLLHPPVGCVDGNVNVFDPKASAASAQIILSLQRQDPSELIQNLIFQLAHDEAAQSASALAGLIGVSKSSQINSCPLLVPHFEMIFELISHRLFSKIPEIKPVSPASRKKLKALESSNELLAGWPKMKTLTFDIQIPILCVRFLSVFVSSLIRQHTRGTGESGDLVVDVDVVSSIRSISVGFFLTRVTELSELPNRASSISHISRLQYSVLKGLITCLPDASVSDLTSHLLPLFLALQDTDQRLRYKLSTLLCRFIRNRRISDSYTPLLFFAGAHESSLLIKSTLKALLGEILRTAGTSLVEELLPVLIVFTVKHPDYTKDLLENPSTQELLKEYYSYFVENALDINNCGGIYEAVSRLKLYQFVPMDSVSSHRLYFASELAQETIRDRCNHHHWPLQSTNKQQQITKSTTLSLLVPDILIEMNESMQLQNIHRVYTASTNTEEIDENRIGNQNNNTNLNFKEAKKVSGSGSGSGSGSSVSVKRKVLKKIQ